nr:hypothetical protein [Amaricoccus solimangrovi]
MVDGIHHDPPRVESGRDAVNAADVARPDVSREPVVNSEGLATAVLPVASVGAMARAA